VPVEGGNNYFCSGAFVGTPCETAITAGDTVTWTMVGGVHTVTQCNDDFSVCPPSGGWDSSILTNGNSYSQTFASPGTYPYRCELHPSEMLGKIVVAAVVTPSPTPVVTSEPTRAAATGSTTATPVALPKTGGAPGSGDAIPGSAIAVTLLAGAALSFVLAMRRAS
jgi:plastocyanin